METEEGGTTKQETLEETRETLEHKNEKGDINAASVVSLVGPIAQGLRVFILQEASAGCDVAALFPLENKSFIFEDLPPVSTVEGQGRHLSPFHVSVHLRALGLETQQQQQQGIGSKGGAVLVVIGGVAEDLLQEEFLCLLVRQRMHVTSSHPLKAFRLCYVPESPAGAAAAAAAAAAAEEEEELIDEDCISMRVGSSMREVLEAARKAGASVLHVLPMEGRGDILPRGDMLDGEASPPLSANADKSLNLDEGSFFVAFPPELEFSKDVVAVTIGLPSGGRFAVSNVPESVTTGALLAGIRAAIASAPGGTLVRFPTGITPASLVLLSSNGERRLPDSTPITELCSVQSQGDTEKETRPQSTDGPPEHSNSNCGRSPSADVLLQFKFRPLEAPEFLLRMQPLNGRVLDFQSLLFSRGPPPTEDSP
ncbi:hypothetical protein ACSSS7_001707 [Eimeria intestinalis]